MAGKDTFKKGDAESGDAKKKPGRLVSLDAYRGFVMLAMASSGLAFAAVLANEGPLLLGQYAESSWAGAWQGLWETLAYQFSHCRWVGCSFWDLIQPSFMFMVGVAMPFSFSKRRREGQSGLRRFGHVLVRAVVLVLLGVFLSSNSARYEMTNFTFVNVLTQIGLGYAFLYLLLNRAWWLQLLAAAAVLGGYWYYFYSYETPQEEKQQIVAYLEEVKGLSAVEARYEVEQFADHEVLDGLRGYLAGPRGLPPEEVRAELDQIARDGVSVGERKAVVDYLAEVLAVSTQEAEKRLDRFSDPEAPLVEHGKLDFSAHFNKHTNAAAAADRWLLNELPRQGEAWNGRKFWINDGGYQTLNFVPSLATMIFGLMAGGLLITDRKPGAKFRWLLVAGAVCFLISMALDTKIWPYQFESLSWSLCPTVKRIWTPNWAVFSAGWTFWMLAGFYAVIDIWGFRRLAFPLAVVGMNSIAMYCMSQMIKPWVGSTLERHLATISAGLSRYAGISYDIWERTVSDNIYGQIWLYVLRVFVLWLICVWLYRRKIFIRI